VFSSVFRVFEEKQVFQPSFRLKKAIWKKAGSHRIDRITSKCARSHMQCNDLDFKTFIEIILNRLKG
jgi:hypothetical protein